MKKRVLTLMVTMLAMMMLLVACGDSKETSSDSKKEKKEKVEAEIESDKSNNDADYSGDGGAPVDSETPGTNTETDTEVVEPVSTTFTLVDEDGTVVFEGNVPANLTLVDGNGTSHIEFAYADNSDVSVYLDAGVDYDVLAAYKYNSRVWHGNAATPQELIADIDAYIAENNIPADELTIADENPYKPFDMTEIITANGTNNYMYMTQLNNYICYANEGANVYVNDIDVAGKFYVVRYDEYGFAKECIIVDDPDNSEYGYFMLKASSVKTDAGLSETPFTISLKVDQPDVASLTPESMENTYYLIGRGYDGYYDTDIVDLFTNVIKSFNS